MTLMNVGIPFCLMMTRKKSIEIRIKNYFNERDVVKISTTNKLQGQKQADFAKKSMQKKHRIWLKFGQDIN